MNISPSPSSITYPRGFLDFLMLKTARGHRVGEHELQPSAMARMNAALRQLSAESPALTLDQVATAAQRALQRHSDGSPSAFVEQRMDALATLRAMASDPGWGRDEAADGPALAPLLAVIDAYQDAGERLLPPDLPVVGGLDVAVLVDVLLQLVRSDLADYEAFCRFRRVAADYAGIPLEKSRIGREQWLQALQQAQGGSRGFGPPRTHYVPDPRLSLFHVV